jgi:hypothetical protein
MPLIWKRFPVAALADDRGRKIPFVVRATEPEHELSEAREKQVTAWQKMSFFA